MEKVTGYLIDVFNYKSGSTTIDKSMESYRETLESDCVDIVRRFIGVEKREYAIIYDVNGKQKEDIRVGGYTTKIDPVFYGSLFIAKYGDDGELTDISEDDVKYLKRYTNWYPLSMYPDPFPSLCCIEYE